MTQHTPGPWFVVNDGSDDEPMMSVKAARIVGKPPRHEVAICATGDSPQEMETANACLIAAAPDLLAALKNARSFMIPGMNWTDEIGQQMVIDADAAIAKAEGRTP